MLGFIPARARWPLVAVFLLLAVTPMLAQPDIGFTFGSGTAALRPPVDEYAPWLDLDNEGTIEFWLKADQVLPPGKPIPVIVHGDDPTGLDYRIVIKADRSGLHLVRQGDPDDATIKEKISIPCNFANRQWHHIAIVVCGSESCAYVDGARVTNPGQQTYHFLAGTSKGRPLTVGGGSFRGGLRTLRFWNRALTGDEVSWLFRSNQYGKPDLTPVKPGAAPDHRPNQDYLMAYYTMMNDPVLNYTRPKIYFTPFAGGGGGVEVFARRPPGYDPIAFFAKTVSGRLTDLQVEYDLNELDHRVERFNFAEYSSGVPVILPIRWDSANVNDLQTHLDQQIGAAVAARAAYRLALATNPANAGAAMQRLEDRVRQYRTVVIGKEDARFGKGPMSLNKAGIYDTIWNAFRPVPSYYGSRDPKSAVMVQREEIVGVAGTSGLMLNEIRFLTDRGNKSPLFGKQTGLAGDAFTLSIPKTAPDGSTIVPKFQGLVVRRSDQGVHSIALAYSGADMATNPQDPGYYRQQAYALASGRWVDERYKEPILRPTPKDTLQGTTQSYGNFTSNNVYRFTYQPSIDELTLYVDNFSTGSWQVLSYSLAGGSHDPAALLVWRGFLNDRLQSLDPDQTIVTRMVVENNDGQTSFTSWDPENIKNAWVAVLVPAIRKDLITQIRATTANLPAMTLLNWTLANGDDLDTLQLWHNQLVLQFLKTYPDGSVAVTDINYDKSKPYLTVRVAGDPAKVNQVKAMVAALPDYQYLTYSLEKSYPSDRFNAPVSDTDQITAQLNQTFNDDLAKIDKALAPFRASGTISYDILIPHKPIKWSAGVHGLVASGFDAGSVAVPTSYTVDLAPKASKPFIVARVLSSDATQVNKVKSALSGVGSIVFGKQVTAARLANVTATTVPGLMKPTEATTPPAVRSMTYKYVGSSAEGNSFWQTADRYPMRLAVQPDKSVKFQHTFFDGKLAESVLTQPLPPDAAYPDEKPPEGSDRDKLGYGANFSAGEQPGYILPSYWGYNPLVMKPKRLIENTGAGKNHFIFRYPSASGAESYTRKNMFIPFGMTFVRTGDGNSVTHTDYSSSAKQSHSRYASSVGFSLGIPKIASFSYDTDTTREIEEQTKQSLLTTNSRMVVSNYALVMDRARIQLNTQTQEYMAKVLELRDKLRAGQMKDPANRQRLFEDFFQIFGTHYPYAITYGGTYNMVLQVNENEYNQMKTSGTKVTVSAEVELGKLAKAGGKASVDQSFSKMFDNAARTEREKDWAYGGAAGTGGSWSCPDKSEMPIYMDLRPQYELLSPIFFDDAIIWTKLRDYMEVAIDAYVAKQLRARPPIWANSGSIDWAKRAVLDNK